MPKQILEQKPDFKQAVLGKADAFSKDLVKHLVTVLCCIGLKPRLASSLGIIAKRYLSEGALYEYFIILGLTNLTYIFSCW